jgi:hypothetical protein
MIHKQPITICLYGSKTRSSNTTKPAIGYNGDPFPSISIHTIYLPTYLNHSSCSSDGFLRYFPIKILYGLETFHLHAQSMVGKLLDVTAVSILGDEVPIHNGCRQSCSLRTAPWRFMWEWRYNSACFSRDTNCKWGEWSTSRSCLFNSEESSPISTGLYSGWVPGPEPIRMVWWRTEKSVTAGNRSTVVI